MGHAAIYAGSFDPVTMGHLDVIQRGVALFDRLVVAVGNNPSKRYWFDLEARAQMVRDCTGHLPTVEVVSFDGLLVDACAEQGVTVILRGLRMLSDFDLEFRNGLANRDLAGMETVFLLTDPKNIFVSSSLVKEVAIAGGDVSRWVPGPVAARITRLNLDQHR
jgi:pantetheine-phosphate adenylyltransferase